MQTHQSILQCNRMIKFYNHCSIATVRSRFFLMYFDIQIMLHEQNQNANLIKSQLSSDLIDINITRLCAEELKFEIQIMTLIS